jgi:hypothetical protein
MLPATSTQILLVVSGFVTAVACIFALLSRRAQLAERRRLRRKMLGINDQYRLMRQDLRDAEDARGWLQRELNKSEDSRRELDLLCQKLEEEIRRLREARPAPLQQELDLAPPAAPVPDDTPPEPRGDSTPEAPLEEGDGIPATELVGIPESDGDRTADPFDGPGAAPDPVAPTAPLIPAKTAGPRRAGRGRITPKRPQAVDSDGDHAETA